MRKIIVCFVVLLAASLASSGAPPDRLPSLVAPAQAGNVVMQLGGGVPVEGCTTPSSHTYDQGFETDFPLSGWTTSASAPTSGASLSGTPPTSSCTKGMTGADDTTTRNAYYNHGSTLATFYFRLDIYFSAITVATWDHQLFFAAGQSTSYDSSTIGYLRYYDVGGDPEFSFNGASSVIVYATPTTNTWYQITGYIDSVTPANSWIKVNGGSPVTIAPHAVAPQYFHLGDVNGKQSAAWQIGYFAIDDSEISHD